MSRLTPGREAFIRENAGSGFYGYGAAERGMKELLAELEAVRAERDAALARQAAAIEALSWPKFLGRFSRRFPDIQDRAAFLREVAAYLDDVLYSLKGKS